MQRLEGFGRRQIAWQHRQAQRDPCRDDRDVAVRRDDQPTAGSAHRHHIVCRQHRSGADDRLRTDALREPFDAAERVG